MLAPVAWAQWYGDPGYAYPVYASPNVTVMYQQPPQSVVVVDEPVMRVRLEPQAPQVYYLIAFKCGEIRAAEQYWVNGSILYYVTADHQLKTAPVDGVDRSFSVQLNRQQNVAFTLPPMQVQEKAVVRSAAVRRTASVVRRRSTCGPR